MADSTSDKQIYELLQIKLGLEQAADKIFAGLLKDGDPLDDIFRSISNKNREIEQLKKQLTKAQLELQKYKKQGEGSGPGMRFAHSQQRHKSLPDGHEQKIKNVEQNKKAVLDAKQQVKDRTEAFIIFLIKCIRELSRNSRPEDVEKLVKKIDDSLRKQQERILDPEEFKNKNRLPSQRTTAYTRASQQNLQNLVNDISETKDPQKVFEKISMSLGLQSMWQKYIGKLKRQSSLFYFLKDRIIKPVPNPELRFGNVAPTFEESMKETHSMFTTTINQRIRMVVQNTEKQSIENIVNAMLEQKRKQLSKPNEMVFPIIKSTVEYFYQSLDKFFVKHNQHPFQLVKRPNLNIVHEKVLNHVVNGQWKQAQGCLRDEIDEAFHFMERKTKFYSANRVILRSH